MFIVVEQELVQLRIIMAFIIHQTDCQEMLGVAVILAELLLRPFLRLCIDPIFRMMGMEVAVDYAINPIEVYVVLPLVVLGTTMITAFLTVLYTKRIKAADVAGL